MLALYCRYALSRAKLVGDDAGARPKRGSFHPESMGVEIRPGTGQADSSSFAVDERFMASG